jgi:hypothetical protein
MAAAAAARAESTPVPKEKSISPTPQGTMVGEVWRLTVYMFARRMYVPYPREEKLCLFSTLSVVHYFFLRLR